MTAVPRDMLAMEVLRRPVPQEATLERLRMFAPLVLRGHSKVRKGKDLACPVRWEHILTLQELPSANVVQLDSLPALKETIAFLLQGNPFARLVRPATLLTG